MTQEQFNAQMRKFNEELTILNTPIRQKQEQYETEMANIRISIQEASAKVDHGKRLVNDMHEELHAHKFSLPKGEGHTEEREAWAQEHEAIRARLKSQDRINLIHRDNLNQLKVHHAQLKAAWSELERLRKANATMVWEKQHQFVIANPKDTMEG